MKFHVYRIAGKERQMMNGIEYGTVSVVMNILFGLFFFAYFFNQTGFKFQV